MGGPRGLVGVLSLAVAVLAAAGGVDLGFSALPASGAATVGHPNLQTAAMLGGPVAGGHIIEPLAALPPGLTAHGYVEQEFFASGTATAFRSTSSPVDGKWSITPTTQATYRTRIIVRRPRDPAHFNGTLVVEWMNESAGESAPDWDYLNPQLMRQGYAYVAVSAQAVGVNGGTPILGSAQAGASGGLVGIEPARYGSLHHPGDQYALDIFAQIARALRAPKAAALGGLHPRHVLAVGESQSAYFLTTFADAVQPRTDTFDGIFIHSRGGAGAPLDGSSITSDKGAASVRIRTDLKVPVFMFETQTDLITLGYAAAQQPNTARIRTWEVAGTSHADAYEVGAALGVLGCTTPVNDGPQHIVAQAAFTAFDTWVDGGAAPPSPPPFRLSGTAPAALALDGNGNVIGGVRTPAVDVPVSTLSGAAPAGANLICSLFGSATAFDQARLEDLYHSRAGYLAAYRASLDQAVDRGFILKADRSGLLAQAAYAAQVGLPS